ncbi:MAG: RNA ligase family protein, partial [bacterium]|nr:RNA ligase family protein [bacterium]
GDLLKFPRPPHTFGSTGTSDDQKLGKKASMDRVRHRALVVEEKVDGSNSAVQFIEDGILVLQNRGQYWTEKESVLPWEKGLTHPQYNLFKNWSLAQKDLLYKILGTRYIMYGEWMYAKHHIFYNRLPHYFLEFDIYDRREQCFIDSPSRRSMLENSGIFSVGILHEGPLKGFEDMQEQIGPSLYTDDTAEGLYLKVEENGRVTARAKYVRKTFTQEILDLGRHWADVKMVKNLLAKETTSG